MKVLTLSHKQLITNTFLRKDLLRENIEPL